MAVVRSRSQLKPQPCLLPSPATGLKQLLLPNCDQVLGCNPYEEHVSERNPAACLAHHANMQANRSPLDISLVAGLH